VYFLSFLFPCMASGVLSLIPVSMHGLGCTFSHSCLHAWPRVYFLSFLFPCMASGVLSLIPVPIHGL
jgi:hypothetical protein